MTRVVGSAALLIQNSTSSDFKPHDYQEVHSTYSSHALSCRHSKPPTAPQLYPTPNIPPNLILPALPTSGPLRGLSYLKVLKLEIGLISGDRFRIDMILQKQRDTLFTCRPEGLWKEAEML